MRRVSLINITSFLLVFKLSRKENLGKVKKKLMSSKKKVGLCSLLDIKLGIKLKSDVK